jgi:putative endonuclease
MYYVYVLQNIDDLSDFYIGYSTDLGRRLQEHNSGGNYSTRGRQWKVVYYEAYIREKAARQREQRLKDDGRVRRFLTERLKEHL